MYLPGVGKKHQHFIATLFFAHHVLLYMMDDPAAGIMKLQRHVPHHVFLMLEAINMYLFAI